MKIYLKSTVLGLPWRRRQQAPPRHWNLQTNLHDITS